MCEAEARRRVCVSTWSVSSVPVDSALLTPVFLVLHRSETTRTKGGSTGASTGSTRKSVSAKVDDRTAVAAAAQSCARSVRRRSGAVSRRSLTTLAVEAVALKLGSSARHAPPQARDRQDRRLRSRPRRGRGEGGRLAAPVQRARGGRAASARSAGRARWTVVSRRRRLSGPQARWAGIRRPMSCSSTGSGRDPAPQPRAPRAGAGGGAGQFVKDRSRWIGCGRTRRFMACFAMATGRRGGTTTATTSRPVRSSTSAMPMRTSGWRLRRFASQASSTTGGPTLSCTSTASRWCYSSSRRRTSASRHAYDDNLTDYRDTIPALFFPNGFILLSNGSEAKVGATYAPWEFFGDWKVIDAEATGALSPSRPRSGARARSTSCST